MSEPDDSRMLRSLATTDVLAEVFSDASYLAAMLRFEVALSQAEADLGLVPANAADAIARAADPSGFKLAAMVVGARSSGSLAIPLVEQLRHRVAEIAPDAVPFVHRGATSQDVLDTSLVLCLAEARKAMAADHQALLAALRTLSDQHAGTLMLARTLLQPAAPTTFGLKVAGWFAAVDVSGRRLFDAFDTARVLQFGGAAGTLASLGKDGPSVAERLAAILSLRVPPAPWHTHRDVLAALVTACGLYVGALGKIARDLSLLMQFEVAEAAEPGGGSSAMPHKRNPAACAVVLAAATRMPGLVANTLAAMPQEHERGLGNWHAESATVPDAVQTTGAAVLAMRGALEGLQVDRDKMRADLEGTRGVIVAERALALLSASVGAVRAKAAVDAALDASAREGRHFVDALASIETVRAAIRQADLEELRNPHSYLGSAEHFRRRLLQHAGEDTH